MSKRKDEQLSEIMKQCGAETILRAAALCNGHSILKPQAFVEAGLPAQVVEHMTKTYKSDATPKGSIYVNGEAVKELRGIYGLHVLRFLAAAFDVEYQEALGRGTEARNIKAALRQHFARLLDADRRGTNEAPHAH